MLTPRIVQAGNGVHGFRPAIDKSRMIEVTDQEDYGLWAIIVLGWFPDAKNAAIDEWRSRWNLGSTRFQNRKGWAGDVDRQLGLKQGVLADTKEDKMAEYTKINGFDAYVVRWGSKDVAIFAHLSHAIAFIRSTEAWVWATVRSEDKKSFRISAARKKSSLKMLLISKFARLSPHLTATPYGAIHTAFSTSTLSHK